ncbi:hypothetical protein [Galactobacter valiniphilus]|nr:hypothetical protein [Galactobacter valiniphilus]
MNSFTEVFAAHQATISAPTAAAAESHSAMFIDSSTRRVKGVLGH